jgi:hypothetical protein
MDDEHKGIRPRALDRSTVRGSCSEFCVIGLRASRSSPTSASSDRWLRSERCIFKMSVETKQRLGPQRCCKPRQTNASQLQKRTDGTVFDSQRTDLGSLAPGNPGLGYAFTTAP